MSSATFKPIDALETGTVRAVTHGEVCARFLEKLEGTPLFACVVGSTDTAEIPNISAAGATPEKRRYTAALDAEFLVHGETRSLDEIPRNPLGPPSPVVITQAALLALECAPIIVDSGSRIPPKTPLISLDCAPGASILTGKALSLPPGFRDRCRETGQMLALLAPWLILAETVPGGTTTALSLLTALGIEARGKVSSSMPGGNHSLKDGVVDQALAEANLSEEAHPLEIAAAVGDPMQPALALMALEASLHAPVVLGGGTQMAAVWALMVRLAETGEPCNLDNVALATTRWVAVDESADLAGILDRITHPCDQPFAAFAAWLDFSDSSLTGLARYEEGLVKEGVGAGAAAFAALTVGGLTHDEMVERIEEVTRQIDEE